jgi:hypothetical protein
MLEMLDVAIGFATVMLAVSLIIMSLTQGLASLLALRGARLRRGIEELIKQTLPSVVNQLEQARLTPKQLSERVLQHPLVSDSATRKKGRWGMATAIKVEELLPVLDNVLSELGLNAVIEVEKKRLGDWFDAFMARVSQWFVMNTRWITVGLAIPVAFGMHLDSVEVIKRIKTDTETRAKLTAMSASLLDQSPEAVKYTENAYRVTLSELEKANAGQFVAQPNAETRQLVSSKPEAVKWIGENAKDPSQVADLTRKFDTALEPKLTEALNKSIDRVKTLQSELGSAGISIYPGGDHTYRHWLNPFTSHFLGMTASVLFLSLGAPFWFNTLKNMTSLKSIVAQKEERSTTSTPATRPATPPAPPPPTPPVPPPATPAATVRGIPPPTAPPTAPDTAPAPQSAGEPAVRHKELAALPTKKAN